MAKKDDGMVRIRGVLRAVNPQTTQYKPLNYEIGFDGMGGDLVLVELSVPSIDVVEEIDEESESNRVFVIDTDGFKAILVSLAKVLDEADAQYRQLYQR